ncbi:Alpha-galactosidase [Exophiala dermatitidis]
MLGYVVLICLAQVAYGASGLSYNGLVQTPQMGWDTYNAYALDYNETTILTNADRLVSLGFRDLGYRVVIFDDAMTERNRSANGSLIENHSKFPSGLRSIADRLHASGLYFGVYSSAGRFTCGGYPGSLGYETTDAQWWATLGADYLKYDNCYNEGLSGTPKLSQDRYASMSNALNSTGRQFVYSLCNWGDDKPWEWASTIANSARISGDIQDSFSMPTSSCPCGPEEYYCQLPGYGCSVVNILGKASHITSKNQPGYFNDLDMIEVGNGGMSYDEYKVHFSMWAAIKSPLILGNKLDQLSPQDYALLINPAILAISQDPAGSAIQRRIRTEVDDKDQYGFGEVQVWSGSLANGDQVVAFLNAGNASRTMQYSLVDVFGGITTNENAQKGWDLFDVWGNQTLMSNEVASQVLNGTLAVGNATGYYNASDASWAQGLNQSNPLLFGTPVGSVQGGGTLSANVPRHGIQMWRLRPQEGMRKRDEL